MARASPIIASPAKMLYTLQHATSLIKNRANWQQRNQQRCQTRKRKAISTLQHPHPGISGFEQEFGINPGTDIDAETDRTLRKADTEVELRHVNDLPVPPPGMRIGSPQYRVYREEVYQSLNMQLNSMKRQLGDYYEKRRQVEKLRKEMLSATRAPERRANTA